MSRGNHILLSAGGTGGHMFPAASLARALKKRGREVSLVTDPRGLRYPGILRGIDHEVLGTGSPTGSGLDRLKSILFLIKSVTKTAQLLRRKRIGVVVGFGGYPALPALAAARLLRVPIILHEQNAVLGRTNRLFAASARSLALSFANTRLVPDRAQGRSVVTGNPVRGEISRIGKDAYPSIPGGGILRILIVGGSQGARIFSDVAPQAISLLPVGLRDRIQITQQCRQEDLERVEKIYAAFNVHAELAAYFNDIPERLRWAHLVIARAGATTVAEVAAAGRPVILVPLGIATDDHQRANAGALEDAGGGWVLTETEFTSAMLAKRLIRLFREPDQLRKAAKKSLGLARQSATSELANIVESALPKGAQKADAQPQEKRQTRSAERNAERKRVEA